MASQVDIPIKRKNLFELLAGIAIIIFLALMAVCTFVPYERTGKSFCPYCQAMKLDRRTYFDSGSRIQEGSLAKYWKREVDPFHNHTWIWMGEYTYTLLGKKGHNGPPEVWVYWLGLNQDAEVAILRSLKTPEDRRRFVIELLYSSDRDKFVSTANTAYTRDPNRKDWHKLLAKYHLLPNSSKQNQPSNDP